MYDPFFEQGRSPTRAKAIRDMRKSFVVAVRFMQNLREFIPSSSEES